VAMGLVGEDILSTSKPCIPVSLELRPKTPPAVLEFVVKFIWPKEGFWKNSLMR